MNVILMKGMIDSLDGFAEALRYGFEKAGCTVLLVDVGEFNKEVTALQKIDKMIDSDNTFAVFFNHVGMFMENAMGDNYWDSKGIRYFDILVDPPVFYHDTISSNVKNVIFLCVDESHVEYIHRFYNGMRKAYYLPLAGIESDKSSCKYSKRSIDIAFTGNYHDYRNINPELQGLDEGLVTLWDAVYDTMLRNVSLSLVEAVEVSLQQYHIELNNEQMLELIRLYKRIDSIIRSRFREKVIRTIVDAGIIVHVYGDNWSDMKCLHPENLIIHSKVSYIESVELMGNVKISMNIMPWFKKGFHDRIPTAMLSGCVCVTDSSSYIEEKFKDGTDIILYDMNKKSRKRIY